MRLASFVADGDHRFGLIRANEVLVVPHEPGLPETLLSAIVGGPSQTNRAVAAAREHGKRMNWFDVEPTSPIPRPARNIFCVGKNYREHAVEFHSSGFDRSATAAPAAPIFFTKATSAVVGPLSDIRVDL